MTLRLGGDGAITGCTSLENPDLTVSGLTISGSFDAEKVLVASGTAAAPSYTFSGDTDNGLYYVGTNSIGLATAGENAISIDANRRVSIGGTDIIHVHPALTINTDTAGGLLIAGGASSEVGIHFSDSGGGDGGKVVYHPTDNYLSFYTFFNEQLRIDSSGNVGIGTSSPGKLLSLQDSTTPALGFYTGSALRAEVNATSSETSILSYANSPMTFNVGGSAELEALRIDSSGRLLVGTTTAGEANADDLTISSAGHTGITIRATDSTTSNIYFADGTSGTNVYTGAIIYDHSNDCLKLHTNGGQERMRVDSSGRLLVGTSSSTWPYKIVSEGGIGFAAGSIAISRAQAGSTIASGGDIGYLAFGGNDNTTFALISAWADGTTGSSDYPGRLVFSTTASGASSPTERMRIDSLGNVGIGTTSPNDYSTAGYNTLTLNGTQGGVIDFESNGGFAGQIFNTATEFTVASQGSLPLNLRTNAINRLTINSTGAIVLPNGSPGIQFGTFSSPATSTNLDDYEEGTFTPTIQGTSTAGTATYTNNYGQYVKVGQLVTVQLYVAWHSGTGSGQLRIHDLPFSVNTIVNSYGGVAIGYWHNIPLATGYYPQLFLSNTSNYIFCYQAGLGGGTSSVVAYAATGGGIIVSVTYRTA